MDNDNEVIKDIRMMLFLLVKDYKRLSDDLKVLSDCLLPLQGETNDDVEFDLRRGSSQRETY